MDDLDIKQASRLGADENFSGRTIRGGAAACGGAANRADKRRTGITLPDSALESRLPTPWPKMTWVGWMLASDDASALWRPAGPGGGRGEQKECRATCLASRGHRHVLRRVVGGRLRESHSLL